MIEERHLERLLKTRKAFLPDQCYQMAIYSLIERTDTKIVLKCTQIGKDCPFADNVQNWVKWEIMTPDPRSHQTVHRQTHFTYWEDKPLVFTKMIDNVLEEGMKKTNEPLKKYFREGAEKYLKGPPYDDPAVIDGQFVYLQEKEKNDN